MIEYDEDIASFYVEVDYIIVARNHVMSQLLRRGYDTAECWQEDSTSNGMILRMYAIDSIAVHSIIDDDDSCQTMDRMTSFGCLANRL
jgi:hypothetical protein